MPYVERKDGKVVGLYANLQTGYAEEKLAEDHPEVVAFLNPPPTKDDVNAERDKRIASGVPYGGYVYDFDAVSKDNIIGAATLAKFAMIAGAGAGNYRWATPDTDFTWIVQSNEKVPLDAPTMSALGDIAASWTTRHFYAARAIKDMDQIPADFTDDKYWP